MVDECYRCGLDFSECQCFIFTLEKRVEKLEEELDKLTDVVYQMNEYIKENFE